jgi:hypothetical protein
VALEQLSFSIFWGRLGRCESMRAGRGFRFGIESRKSVTAGICGTRPFAQNAKGRGTHSVGEAGIKSLGHPPDVKRIPEMGTSLSIGRNYTFPCKLFVRWEIKNLEKCPDWVGQNDILDIEGLNF